MTCGNKKRILFVMQSLYDGGAEKLLVDMLNNFDYSKYDIDLLLEHDRMILHAALKRFVVK